MERIVRIPKKLDKECFSDPRLRNHFTKPQWAHFRSLVLTFMITTWRHTIPGLDRALAFGPHRTKRRDFAVISPWEGASVLRAVARIRLEKLGVQPGETIRLVLDDSNARKYGRKMQGAGEYRDMSPEVDPIFKTKISSS